ncbi:MAG TPA: hypothetical protein VIM76_09725 [Candidatus Dormibacteraeota bacterium]
MRDLGERIDAIANERATQAAACGGRASRDRLEVMAERAPLSLVAAIPVTFSGQ